MAKFNFGHFILNSLASALQPAVAETFSDILEKLRASNPENHKLVVTSLYGPVDVHLENLAKKSKTKIDDSVVLGLKEAIEFSADQGGVVLDNIDAGQPGD
jgi:hypothetical protein